MLKKLSVFFLGFFFVLLAAEISLRVLGASYFLHENVRAKSNLAPDVALPANYSTDPDAFRILCIGNSHTQGSENPAQSSFPVELENLIKAKYPGAKVQVFNTGRGNWNSSEILDNLPRFMKKFNPHVVFAMIGEPNAWNFRFFYHENSSSSWIYNSLRALKVIRLLDLLQRFNPNGEVPFEADFRFMGLTQPWYEYPMLASSWASYLDEQPNLNEVPRGELVAARKALERWTVHPTGKGRITPMAALARIQFHLGDPAAAVATANHLLDSNGNKFDLRLWNLANSPNAGAFAEIKKKLEARIPEASSLEKIQRIFSKQESPPEGVALKRKNRDQWESFLKLGVDIAPGALVFCKGLANIYRNEKRSTELRGLIANCLRENFSYDSVQQLARKETGLPSPLLEKILMESGPPMVGMQDQSGVNGEYKKKAMPYLISEEELEGENVKIQKWVLHDLRRTAEIVDYFHSKLILQTYPIYRKSKRERWPDPLIRAVAREQDIPLSDTSAYFKEVFAREDSEPYYQKLGMPVQDDHLNQRGNKVVAQMMFDKMLELGIKPIK